MQTNTNRFFATHAQSLGQRIALKWMIFRSFRLTVLVTLSLLPAFSHADSGQARDGRSLYTTYCTACHAPENVMVSSPKLGDKNEWGRRLSTGLDQATDRAVKGFGAMPPKGGCMDCTRDEIRRAIQFMANPNASN